MPSPHIMDKYIKKKGVSARQNFFTKLENKPKVQKKEEGDAFN